MDKITLITKPQAEYELLDSGGEEKLERFGGIVVSRPDPQALWPKTLATSQWELANGVYKREGQEGKWVGKLPKEWQIKFGGLQFLIKPTSFKHVGLFPEHLPGWEWVEESLNKAQAPRVLNLFGYTGGYTLAAAKAGAEVTHVDASKAAVAWARENAKLSGLEDAPIRWIVEDVLVYLRRELKRGSKYDAIIMDPPQFGHGPKDELWKFDEHFLELMALCEELLSDKPLFVLINGYAAGYSPLAFAHNLESFKNKFGGKVEHGDLAIQESNSGRLLPAGIFARWSAN
ncbi:MAG TPA: class I SAM-dependent methyltransferase [Candidatus Paceibacterota bacterium]